MGISLEYWNKLVGQREFGKLLLFSDPRWLLMDLEILYLGFLYEQAINQRNKWFLCFKPTLQGTLEHFVMKFKL